MNNRKFSSFKLKETLPFIFISIFIVICLSILHTQASENKVKSQTDALVEKIVKIQDDIQEKEKIKDTKNAEKQNKVEMPVEIPVEKQEMSVCGLDTATKSYMPGSTITDTTSNQWSLLQTMSPNQYGIYQTSDGYYGAALGSYYGPVGSKFEFTLDNGKVFPIIKLDEKADRDTINGCYQNFDGSMLEWVIDPTTSFNYFGPSSNGYVLNGNFNNSEEFHGSIVSIQRILE